MMFHLKKGDKVGIASPAGFLTSPKDIELAVKYLTAHGFVPVIGKHVFDKYFYMAGKDEARASDVNRFFADPEVKAIFTTAGGCGSQRILPYLDYQLIKKNKKPLFGLSDNTSLQNALLAKAGCPSVTGFSLKYDFKSGNISAFTEASLLQVWAGKKQKIKSGETLNPGRAQGELIGGCLSTFRNLCGTPYFPALKGKILLIEDVGERTHKIGVMLTQLSQQKDFDKLAGIIFGKFVNCEPFEAQDGSVDEALQEFAQNFAAQIPVIKNFDYGHVPNRYVLPLGQKVQIDALSCLLEYL